MESYNRNLWLLVKEALQYLFSSISWIESATDKMYSNLLIFNQLGSPMVGQKYKLLL